MEQDASTLETWSMAPLSFVFFWPSTSRNTKPADIKTYKLFLTQINGVFSVYGGWRRLDANALLQHVDFA